MTISSILFVGHASVLLEGKSGNTPFVIGIDPWFEGNPVCPEALKNTKLDLIVLTHGHSDHAGDAARLAKRDGAAIIATWELANLMIAEGVESSYVFPMNKGGTIEWRSLSITLTHAFHSSSYDTPKGPVYAGEPCGIVIHDGTRSIYHSGDTALFSDMKLIGEYYHPDIALLCIGDRFTMGPREAAHAAALVGCRVAIPIHHSTFPLLTGTPQAFEEASRGGECKVVTLAPGSRWTIA